MGLREQARAVIEARKALIMACEEPCVCDTMTLQRDGCQCGRAKYVVQTRSTLMEKIYALCEEPFEEELIVADPSVLLKVAGRPFHCSCGANVFKRYTNGQYQCNSCDTLYEGE